MILLLNAQQRSRKYQCHSLWFDTTGDRTQVLPPLKMRWSFYYATSIKSQTVQVLLYLPQLNTTHLHPVKFFYSLYLDPTFYSLDISSPLFTLSYLATISAFSLSACRICSYWSYTGDEPEIYNIDLDNIKLAIYIEAQPTEPVSLTFHSALRKLNTEPSIHVGASHQIPVHFGKAVSEKKIFRNQPI